MKMLASLLLLAGAAVASPRDYFPLQAGNQWTLESRNGRLLNIEVRRSRVIKNETYFLVSGYTPGDAWIRQNDDGELFVLEGSDEKIAHLKLGAPAYRTRLSGCEQQAAPAPAPASISDPDTFSLGVVYTSQSCADIGIVNEIYTPGVGLTERAITTFAGEIRYRLVYARVNGNVVRPDDGTLLLHSDFRGGSKRWLASFSDYDLVTGDLQMLAELRPLPDELGGDGTAFFIQSMNRSDDLFMYLKKQIDIQDGVEPNVSYKATFTIHFASNAASGCAGVGGSPGDSVYLKAGASADEPVARLLSGRDVRLNVDKGEQSTGGADAGVVGTIANGRVCDTGESPYVRLTKTYTHSNLVRTDDRGSLWLLVGTDSAFEGLTGLYYEAITVRLEPVRQ